jgi:two-component system CheB/CheR fusion protein
LFHDARCVRETRALQGGCVKSKTALNYVVNIRGGAVSAPLLGKARMPGSRLLSSTPTHATSGDARGHAPSAGSAPFIPIVAVGASAGGLEACQRLLDGVAADTGMAFIVVQHMDPTHDSLLVELLSGHTSMAVRQAANGMRLEPDHVYVIAPGTYLSVKSGVLVVSEPSAPRGARLPFDFLLNALSEDCGARTICVILSGALDDGSAGLRAVKARGGWVIVQDPREAGFDGMPRGAILTGDVDLVCPVANIPAAIVKFGRRARSDKARRESKPRRPGAEALSTIVDLIRDRAGHDFSLYKPGTLQRRISRRMNLWAGGALDMERYLEELQSNDDEINALASDLLIHVTSFFRDPKVFDVLADVIAPELVRERSADDPIRIWVAGCSTGEEAYAIAMVFREQIATSGRDVRLQVFASDVDPEVVAVAREGVFPETISETVSPARLARFFTRDEHGYRISQELRGSVVFTVQNLLTDPPFSRLDLISCRNLLIYLRPEAQVKVIAIFHFALKAGGVLLLGGSESAGRADGRFSVISKPARLYRQFGRGPLAEFSLPSGPGLVARRHPRPGPTLAVGQAALADLCRRLVLEAHAPATILINRARECLYSLGPVDRYLRVVPGSPSLDILAMARHGLRAKLGLAINHAFERNARVVVKGGPVALRDSVRTFEIDARPFQFGGETLLLLCFLDIAKVGGKAGELVADRDAARIGALEAELEATKAELQSAVRGIEMSAEEQVVINEEALSVNEEYQSANEELITSKEELQSLNEELTALNNQLQETLDLQKTSANDLQNILYSTDVATIFLDTRLRIRFFTPATRGLFSVIPGDIGRPLADLNSLVSDNDLLADASAMLNTLTPMSREIQTPGGSWYVRRVMPYRAGSEAAEGVVITYTDITERKRIAKSLEDATLAADSANRAKSRFLAAASHDLRQPLQTLTLIQGLLKRKVEGEAERKLIDLQEQCLNAMSGMLNTLLDINQIDAGIIQAEKVDFPINSLFDRLRDEFAYHAQAKGLTLWVQPCKLSVLSDPALLEQMVRNLIANAVKYTTHGKILVGCRRRGARLQIQVLDTGVGIPAAELRRIFEEYHQIENVARERSRGLGLGLSIVKRLGGLLDHPVDVRSRARRGSVFTIDVELASDEAGSALRRPSANQAMGHVAQPRLSGSVLVVEDDPEVRKLLQLVLVDDGHTVMTAGDGGSALGLIDEGKGRPDVVLVDYNLPGGMTGLEFTAKLRARLGADRQVVVLTGDISTDTLRAIALENCIPLHKPVKPEILARVIQNILSNPASVPSSRRPIGSDEAPSVVFVVDDDSAVREAVGLVLAVEGFKVETFADCEAFLEAYRPGSRGCLLLDAYLPGGMDGLDLLRRLNEVGDTLPTIMITGEADVQIAVRAMKAGAADFIEKPITGPELIDSIRQVLEKYRDASKMAAAQAGAADNIAKLTERQREILDLVLAGHPSKNIAADLRISQRTVENHRAAIMQRTGARSLPALARLALAAAGNPRILTPLA